MSMQYQNTTDENKNIGYTFYSRDYTVKNKFTNKHGSKKLQWLSKFQMFKISYLLVLV